MLELKATHNALRNGKIRKTKGGEFGILSNSANVKMRDGELARG